MADRLPRHPVRPPHAFARDVGDPAAPSASWWYDLEQTDYGVLVRHGVRIVPGPSGLTRAIAAVPGNDELIVARRLQELEQNIAATLHGLKDLAEGP